MTLELNARLETNLTDSFCGFKAYRIESCSKLDLDVDGYDFPMQFWVQAVAGDLRIKELPVRLIYNDPTRTFGGPLDSSDHRRRLYKSTLHREILRCADRLPPTAVLGLAGQPADSVED